MHNFTLKWGAPIFVGVMIIGGGFAYLNERKQDDQVICEAANDNRAVLRNLLVTARAQTPKRRMTPRARRFYVHQLSMLEPLDCGHFNRESLRKQGGGKHPSRRSAAPP